MNELQLKQVLPLERALEPQIESWRQARSLLKRAPQQAAKQLQELAEAGSVLSMMDLGRAYTLGIGVSKDIAEAENWLTRAASSGSVRAHFHLGRFYMRLKKFDRARDVLEFAAVRQFAPALHDLGKIYYLGLGVEKNVSMAEQYLEKASQRGNVFATRLLASLLMRESATKGKKLRGSWLRIRVYFDLAVTICREGLDSEKLIR
jgi:hypothetical protein